jgi:hypothetical protein
MQICPKRACQSGVRLQAWKKEFPIAETESSLDSVFLESAVAGHVTNHPHNVAAICKRYGAIRSEALPARSGADLVAKVTTEWQQT